MNKNLLRLIGVLGLITTFSSFARAQNQKMGDNLGNHKAVKDLQMGNNAVLNTKAIAIGIADVSNANIALQIDGVDKALLVPRVTDLTTIPLANRVNGMIVYSTAEKAFYLFQDGEWTTFAQALQVSDAGIEATGNSIGYTLTPVGQKTMLKLAPADAVNPGVVTATGEQVFGGNKTFNGTLTVGTTLLPQASTFNGALTVAKGLTTLTGNIGTVAAPVSGIVITDAVAASGAATEQVLVVDNATGEVRKSVLAANAFLKQKIAIPALTLGTNESTKIVLTVPSILINDGVVVNFDAADFTGTAGLEYISIINATATGDNQVTVTIADMRQENADGTALVSATALLTGKSFTVTRYRQTGS
ncbi:hypothetical protein [Pedobacter sp. MR2016-24]|uniref:hypothetical protein n=1 Tax=Pedobacter sp. MR2016-24 TaxID=2994466 RepID=UPI0022456E0C|nr:hypothetical protein [Pedobacter sp. MR2016-24]MCX2486114.1 hypothetical protein [Pedobacter sp. MR2016-24]